MKPPAELYDLVMAANLLDRLRDPAALLKDIAPMIRSGGLLMLSCPYTWQEEYTPKSKWLGGFRENGEAMTSYQKLRRLLASEFEEVAARQDILFVTRETTRKFQYIVADLTLWRRRG